ncbi:protein kinase domain-containing protein [Sorangium sp. So ce1099]|uniref:protein kinase domain-containing protein n=1 Tax=Sorangium sp. So ce1099 TaxID=3133331 RepID=UPI003F6003AD
MPSLLHDPRTEDKDGSSTGARPPAVVARRYEVGGALGAGGEGTVFAAIDRLTEREVALKWIPFDPLLRPARVQLQIAILRRLQRPEIVPGVVRLLDDGVGAEDAWLVMERIQGSPFPGSHGGRGWGALEPALVSLLETLARVHAVGVVHCDLKPENVLVNPYGQPVVVDFGIASLGVAGEIGRTSGARVRGTRPYVAPERWWAPATPRADLYAVGVMSYLALVGEYPSSSLAACARALAARGAPRAVAEVLVALLEPTPQDRPASADDVVARIGAARRGISPAAFPRGVVCPTIDVTRPAAFHGPARLLHLPQDAVALLGRRAPSGGDAARDELMRWIHARLATVENGRIRIDRAALDTLDAPAPRNTVRPRRDLLAARALAARGRLHNAEAILRDVIRYAAAPPVDRETVLGAARLWTQVVVAARDRSLTARFLYEISRLTAQRDELAAIEGLTRAYDATVHWTGDGLERACSVARFADRELEQLRWHVRVFAARKVSVEAMLQEVASARRARGRSRHASWRGQIAAWEGRLLYVEERYRAAAQRHEIAAQHATWTSARIEARLNAASAWMEAFSFRRAMRLAARGREEAAASRLPFLEGRAEWIWRTAADRSGVPLSPDVELVDAARHLDAPDLVLVLAVSEATLAYRLGDVDTFVRLSAIAREAGAPHNELLGTATLRALEVAMGVRAPDHDDAQLADRLATRGVPRLALEVAALIEDPTAIGGERRLWLQSLARFVPKRFQHLRVGVLSISECLHRLRIPSA